MSEGPIHGPKAQYLHEIMRVPVMVRKSQYLHTLTVVMIPDHGIA